MTMRFYNKSVAAFGDPNFSYKTDGQGQVVEGYVKTFTNTVQINANAVIPVALLAPKGTTVYSFMVQILTTAGLPVNTATYILDAPTNTLTITLGANLAIGSIITVMYTAI